ncbi:PEP/pyruvate-binding domain-containing protein [Micromonospora sp. Llam7]|uniref:PEP/pyruvate-binding domain-containing protein n=1 Tax=Micromonospora tarapacensis TaxID=2835305 RepID=UPI001C82E64E|nr:PEP/pyruvate-binding domain-containing protein [Micromonospora tarapacensis]MBX7268193.1 PEP/pyruvate-binding domain-containing protein [Micromonospora tarapacensis]
MSDEWLTTTGGGRVEGLGGKGDGLARLVAAGMPVPPALVVTAAAWRAVVEPVAARIEAELADVGTDEPGFAAACARVRALVRDTPDPAGVGAAVAAAYRDFAERHGPHVAVRSSSLAEDSAETSFAGEHDSILWVHGPDEVVAHVRRCWASLYTDRAVAYRRRAGLGSDAMAVVVQHMVDARAAGVMMTLNPVNGDRSVLLVESTWGLGEPLVGGLVTPDRFTMDKVTGEVRRRVLSDKPRRMERDPGPTGGTRWADVPQAQRDAASLTETEQANLDGAAAVGMATHLMDIRDPGASVAALLGRLNMPAREPERLFRTPAPRWLPPT